MDLMGVFRSAHDDKEPPELAPLKQRGVVPVYRGQGYQENAVNFNYILKTGQVPNVPGAVNFNYSIDLKADDAFNRALKTIEDRSEQRIQKSPEMQNLLQKDQWSKQDRETWERSVSQIVKEETAKIPGFKDYRTSSVGDATPKDPMDAAKDIRRLNDLSADIEHNTETERFDCGIESIVKGMTIQKIENRLLPDKAANTSDYKKASSYFYATGGVSFDGQKKAGNHATIFTPAGNMIEATSNTANTKDYVKSAYGNSSLEQLARGKAFVAADGSIYGAKSDEARPAGLAQQAREEHSSRREEGRIYSRDELLGRNNIQGFMTAEDKKDNLIMVASRARKGENDDYEIKLYQKQNIGTPKEGYVIVGYDHSLQAPGVKNVELSATYADKLGNQDYRLKASFDDRGAKMAIGKGEEKVFSFLSDTTAAGTYQKLRLLRRIRG
jgi:hypothetical protein